LGGFCCQRFEHDEILLRAVNLHNVDNAIVISQLEGEIDFTKFTVELFELQNDLLSVDLS